MWAGRSPPEQEAMEKIHLIKYKYKFQLKKRNNKIELTSLNSFLNLKSRKRVGVVKMMYAFEVKKREAPFCRSDTFIEEEWTSDSMDLAQF